MLRKTVTLRLDWDDQALLEELQSLSPRVESSRLLSLCLLGFQVQQQYGFPGSISCTNLRLQSLTQSSSSEAPDPSHWSRRLRIPQDHPAYPLLCDPPHGLHAGQAFLVLCRLGLWTKRNWLQDLSPGSHLPPSSQVPWNEADSPASKQKLAETIDPDMVSAMRSSLGSFSF